MRLIMLEQASFGTLQLAAPLSLDSGLNILIAPNQTGKSTMLTLLEWVLYGVPPKREQKNQELVRQWAPWRGAEPAATVLIAPELAGWPAQVRAEVNFAKFSLRLSDPATLADLTDQVTVNRNGTWDLGDRLLGLPREAYRACVFAPQGELENLVASTTAGQDLRKLLTAGLGQFIENPERATLDAALNQLEKPAFILADRQDTPVQLPTLQRRVEQRLAEAKGRVELLRKRYTAFEEALGEREAKELQQASLARRLDLVQGKLADDQLAAAHWRFSRIEVHKARVAEWDSRLAEAPFLAEFPYHYEQDVERWRGEQRQISEQRSMVQARLSQARSRHGELTDYLEKNEALLQLLPLEEELQGLLAELQAALKEKQAAIDLAREHGEGADPASRSRYEQLDVELAPHYDSLPAIWEWKEAQQTAQAQRNELEAQRAQLKRAAVPVPVWTYGGALLLLMLALMLGILGPRVLGSNGLAYSLTALAALGAILLGFQAGRMRLAADHAALELTKVITPRDAELTQLEGQLASRKAALLQQHELDSDAWERILLLLGEYQRLKFKLERYAEALRMQQVAAQRIATCWATVQRSTPHAPAEAERDWLERLLKRLRDLRDRDRERLDTLAATKDHERELERLQQVLGDTSRRLALLLEPLGLGEAATQDAEAALARFAALAAEARRLASLKADLTKAIEQAANLPLTAGDYRTRWEQLPGARQQTLTEQIQSEDSYESTRAGIRNLSDETAKLRATLEKSRSEVAQLRERTVRDEDVLLGLPAAETELAQAQAELSLVQRWRRAVELLDGALRGLQHELAGALAPRINEELAKVLQQAPVAGVVEAAVGGQLELRLRLADQPAEVSAEALIDLLSTGARRQLALSLRIATTRALVDTHTAPVLLDEPLAELDDQRALEVLRYCAEIAGSTQVVIATCHRVQYDWLLSQGGISAAQPTF